MRRKKARRQAGHPGEAEEGAGGYCDGDMGQQGEEDQEGHGHIPGRDQGGQEAGEGEKGQVERRRPDFIVMFYYCCLAQMTCVGDSRQRQ